MVAYVSVRRTPQRNILAGLRAAFSSTTNRESEGENRGGRQAYSSERQTSEDYILARGC